MDASTIIIPVATATPSWSIRRHHHWHRHHHHRHHHWHLLLSSSTTTRSASAHRRVTKWWVHAHRRITSITSRLALAKIPVRMSRCICTLLGNLEHPTPVLCPIQRHRVYR